MVSSPFTSFTSFENFHSLNRFSALELEETVSDCQPAHSSKESNGKLPYEKTSKSNRLENYTSFDNFYTQDELSALELEETVSDGWLTDCDKKMNEKITSKKTLKVCPLLRSPKPVKSKLSFSCDTPVRKNKSKKVLRLDFELKGKIPSNRRRKLIVNPNFRSVTGVKRKFANVKSPRCEMSTTSRLKRIKCHETTSRTIITRSMSKRLRAESLSNSLLCPGDSVAGEQYNGLEITLSERDVLNGRRFSHNFLVP